jgi:hypothetical protein
VRTSGAELLEMRQELLRARENRRLSGSGGANGRSSIVAPNNRQRYQGSNQAVPMPEPLTNGGQVYGQAQLLVMSATAANIASGGDYVAFQSTVARRGFATFAGPGEGWTHPVSGVYVLTYEHDWASYQGGGTVELEVDGQLIPEGVIASGDAGATGAGTIMYWAEAGTVGKIKITQSSGSTQACNAFVRVGITDPGSATNGRLIETVWLETRNSGSVTTTNVLEDGTSYLIVVEGNADLDTTSDAISGSPDTVIYPSTGHPSSAQAQADADVIYARSVAAPVPVHLEYFLIDTGSGATHVEPVGGPFSTPQPGHIYEYAIIGEGSTVTFSYIDPVLTDNNGQFQISIYMTGS